MKLILSQHCQPMLQPETPMNGNVLVIGSSGSGKTTSVTEPNLKLKQCSYLVSDPKGFLYDKHKDDLVKSGYKVRKLNISDPEDLSTEQYNPLHYLETEHDITQFAHMLVHSANNDMRFKGDPFWLDASELLLCALIGYLMELEDPSLRCMARIIHLMQKCMIDENDSGFRPELDYLFEDLSRACYARRCYDGFRVAAGRTMKSILISLYSLLFRYDSEQMHNLLSKDTMQLDRIGVEKSAVFVIVSDHDRSMDTLANKFFSQAMTLLLRDADRRANHRLKLPVQFILDDFGTNVQIPDFPRMISSFRSRGISTIILLQSEAQLETYYERDASTIMNSCDNFVYTGGNDLIDQRAMALRCGVPLKHIQELKPGSCIVCRRGQAPIFDQLYNLEQVFF